MSRGHDRERDVRELLQQMEWVVARSAGSLGPVDLVALSGGAGVQWPPGLGAVLDPVQCTRVVLFCEVKSTAQGPYERFQPAARKRMRALARKAAAVPVLVWWPPAPAGERKSATLRWIWEPAWPT